MSTSTAALSAEWQVLLAVPTVTVGSLARADVPIEPGVYLWRRDGEVRYIGAASSLRRRVWAKLLGRGVSLGASSLRRNVCELLHGIPTTVTGGKSRQKVTPAQAAAIRDWLNGCTIAWTVCSSAADAAALEGRLLDEYRPPLNRK
ncbi:GIY-YIG nuclease family protein [Agromyces sp. GXQ0307]|uniref:GIY-YIG nuclease family protein n=1 Tax=Agromyces sp. GXQ0307 TaxID=3377835 RepID=UPI00383A2AD4